ncbi:MAG: LVIVD repeat-containing protein [Flavisolibacter sp.]
MKKLLLAAGIGTVLCFVVFFLQGCLKDQRTHTYTIMRPIYQTVEAAKANIKSNAPKTIESPGKIFVYGDYVFLNEFDKGVHIIDNSNPANPIQKAFIDIPGNQDIAVKGNVLYADMYGRLVSVDISDPLNAKLLKDVPDVFPERSYQGGFRANSTMIILGWEKKDTTVAESLAPSNDYILFAQFDNRGVITPASLYSSAKAAPVGIGGSLARFSIVNDYLYAVDHHNLRSVSISNPNDPKVVGNWFAGYDIETIYPLKDKLFLGSMEGLYIYDISNPTSPVAKGNFIHAKACDPVVADEKYAYVTLKAGTTCGSTTNELEIVDIADVTRPSLLKTYAMSGPSGLSKDGNTLFVCDGKDGLKIYDATDYSKLSLIKQISNIEPLDVIAWNRNALVVTKDGLYQYDYSDLANIHRVSMITVSK